MCNKDASGRRQTFGSCPGAFRCPVNNEKANCNSARGNKGKGEETRDEREGKVWVEREKAQPHLPPLSGFINFHFRHFMVASYLAVQGNQGTARDPLQRKH